MIPSGYAEDIVYSEIPLDGSGDLQLTRASNGTRVNSAGLVEVCPWNLLQYSEDFSNAAWVIFGGATITTNTTTAPNGTTTADTFAVASGQYLYQNIAAVAGQSYTISVYLKVASGTKQFKFNTYGSSNDFTSSAITVTTEWQRFEYTFTAVNSGTTGIYPAIVDGLSSASFYIWGAQLNIGSTAKPYFPTTDRLNVPRLTYQNGGGGCPSLLLEPQRTNLILQSNTFNTTWAMFTGPAVTPNTTTSPDGTTSATTLNSSGGTNDFLYQTLSGLTVGATYSFSFYIKNLNSTASRFWGPSGSSIVDLSWSGSTLVSISGTGASFTSVGNDWYRVVQTGTTPTATPTMRIYADVNNTSKSVYIYGAQIEASSYPTSYIPTTSASATRVADACFKTGISSLIGQTEGTLFAQFNKPIDSVNAFRLNLSDGTANNWVFIGFEGLGFRGYIRASNSVILTNNFSGTANVNKIAIAYKSGDYAIYHNGIQIVTGSSSFTFNGTLSQINVGENPSDDNYAVGQIAEILVSKTRLTNAELASLTTI